MARPALDLSAEQKNKARRFLERHHSGGVLVLLNAWDVASARVFAACGAEAVATTSMGVAAAAGYPDVQRIPLAEMLDAAGRIAAAVDVPVTVDMEAGYGDTPEEVVFSIGQVLSRGAVGINIEDGTGIASAPLLPPKEMAERVAAIRQMADRADIHLLINTRVDSFLPGDHATADGLRDAIERGNRYHEAGADCVFVPGVTEAKTIRTLVRELRAPLNVLANPALYAGAVPGVSELQDLGVARVSIGSAAMRATLALLQRLAKQVLGEGRYGVITELLADPEAPRAYDRVIQPPVGARGAAEDA